MSNEIATVVFGEERTRTVLGKKAVVQPHISVERDNFEGSVLWTFSDNGW